MADLGKKGRRGLVVVVSLFLFALLVLLLCAPLFHEASRAVQKRRSYGYGSDAVWGVVKASVHASLAGRPVEQTDELASARGLFMLQDAARFHISKDPQLSEAEAKRLPIRYSYLDGYDLNVLCLKRALADDLPTLPVADVSARAGLLGYGADEAYASWGTSPVLLGWSSSPNLRTVAQQVIADNVLLSVHTTGQVITPDVRTWGIRYALACIREDPATRAEEVAQVTRRVTALAASAEAAAGNDDRAYVRAAFQLVADAATYAQDEASSIHFNDVYGALVEGSSRCYGLSGALKILLDQRGIPNYLCNGTKPTGRHTWNVLYLDGAWYVCDVTLVVDASPDATASRKDAVTYACLTPQRNFYIEHRYAPDPDAQLLQLVYEGIVSTM